MKSFVAPFLSCTLVFSSLPGVVHANESTHWAYDAISAAKENNTSFRQTADHSYAPDSKVTYRAFLSMLIDVLELEVDEPHAGNSWNESYVTTAFQEGLIEHPLNNSINLDTVITREEVAVLLARGLNLPLADKATSFSDAENTTPLVQRWITSLSEEGILNGYADGRFSPKKAVTRAEVATILANIRSWKQQDDSLTVVMNKIEQAERTILQLLNKEVLDVHPPFSELEDDILQYYTFDRLAHWKHLYEENPGVFLEPPSTLPFSFAQRIPWSTSIENLNGDSKQHVSFKVIGTESGYAKPGIYTYSLVQGKIDGFTYEPYAQPFTDDEMKRLVLDDPLLGKVPEEVKLIEKQTNDAGRIIFHYGLYKNGKLVNQIWGDSSHGQFGQKEFFGL
ncbi:S-layer homology domain-containing protein [Aureibacillus halotolerans]|uniref:S-layer family protein n=1 Tax=Aureibacillus halotolerans TaxID=1508390 RepID=A0A4R6U0C1_9BACI|nr:S-layer homology domain-containing protein [Aureibacillus halotolerans]TDQ37715.1 S-layer family protein [Aureibacillus halotolerans]